MRKLKFVGSIVMLAVAAALVVRANTALNIGGHWSGSIFNEVSQPIPAYFKFVQEGSVLKGTGGPNPSVQYPLNGVIADNNEISVRVSLPDGDVFTFVFRYDGLQLVGLVHSDSAPDDVRQCVIKRVFNT